MSPFPCASARGNCFLYPSRGREPGVNRRYLPRCRHGHTMAPGGSDSGWVCTQCRGSSPRAPVSPPARTRPPDEQAHAEPVSLRTQGAAGRGGASAPPSSDSALPPVTLELGCGCARLSASYADKGFAALGVDWWKNKHQPEVPILRIDLASAHGQKLIWRILQQGRVKVVHMAPPCGTMSRAREIPLPQWLKDKGIPEPYPLRSAGPSGPRRHRLDQSAEG